MIIAQRSNNPLESTPTELVDPSVVTGSAEAEAPLLIGSSEAGAPLVTGSVEAEAARPGATIGGRGPASKTFLRALGVPAPDGPESLSRPRANAGVDLARVRSELAQIRIRIDATQSVVNDLVRSIDSGLAQIRIDRDRFSALVRRLDESRTKRTAAGSILTVLGFAVGGPIGAILGNGIGFATLASYDNLSKEVGVQRHKLESTDQQLRSLQARRDQLVAERAPLDLRAAELAAREAALSASIAAQGPAQEVATLQAARERAGILLEEAKVLLGDFRRLSARAASLGVDVETLKAELAQDVEHLQRLVEDLEQALERALFEVAFAVLAAGHGLALLTAGEAKLLRAGIEVVRTLDAPAEERISRLAKILASSVLPAGAPQVTSVATALLNGLGPDRTVAAAKLLADLAALSPSEREAVVAVLDVLRGGE